MHSLGIEPKTLALLAPCSNVCATGKHIVKDAKIRMKIKGTKKKKKRQQDAHIEVQKAKTGSDFSEKHSCWAAERISMSGLC